MKVKIVTCASYGGTGSSAISDLLKEFENCKSLGDFEFRFIQDPDGISDLEYGLIDNNNRLFTGYFIKKFIKQINYYSGNFYSKRYRKYFGEKFYKYSSEYINKIIQLSWKGTWLKEEIEESFIKKVLRVFINNILKRVNINKEFKHFYYKTDMVYSYIDKETFYKFTKEYTNNLFSSLNPNNKFEYLMLDQLVPCSNINRYLNYFYDIKVIVVDRDPRDLYILNKIFWKEGWIPEDIDKFINYFKLIRRHQKYEKEDQDKILRIKFEDLIYDYENSINKIIKFLGLSLKNHKEKKKYFNPDISKQNTKLWEKYKQFSVEIKKIEVELEEYLYYEKKGNSYR